MNKKESAANEFKEIKKIAIKELLENEQLLEKMYQLVLNNYYKISKEKFSMYDYIYTIRANNDGKIIFYKEKDDNIIGYLEIEEAATDKYYLTMLTIDEKDRHQGYGQKILVEAVNYLKGQQAKEIIVHINRSKPWVIALCQKIGFKEDYINKGEEVILSLKID